MLPSCCLCVRLTAVPTTRDESRLVGERHRLVRGPLLFEGEPRHDCCGRGALPPAPEKPAWWRSSGEPPREDALTIASNFMGFE